MTQEKSIWKLFDEAAQQMAAEGGTKMAEIATQQPEMVMRKLRVPESLPEDFVGRKITRLNFELDEIKDTKDGIKAGVSFGGAFKSGGKVSLNGKPTAIDGIAGASIRLAFDSGAELLFETFRTKEPLVVKSMLLREGDSWAQVRNAVRAHSGQRPQLIVLGVWTKYEKETRTSFEMGTNAFHTWNFGFQVLEWGIALQGETFWVAPRTEAIMLDDLETVAPSRPAAMSAKAVFEEYMASTAKRKAAMQRAQGNPAADQVVANTSVAKFLDSSLPIATGKVYAPSEALAPVVGDNDDADEEA